MVDCIHKTSLFPHYHQKFRVTFLPQLIKSNPTFQFCICDCHCTIPMKWRKSFPLKNCLGLSNETTTFALIFKVLSARALNSLFPWNHEGIFTPSCHATVNRHKAVLLIFHFFVRVEDWLPVDKGAWQKMNLVFPSMDLIWCSNMQSQGTKEFNVLSALLLFCPLNIVLKETLRHWQ